VRSKVDVVVRVEISFMDGMPCGDGGVFELTHPGEYAERVAWLQASKNLIQRFGIGDRRRYLGYLEVPMHLEPQVAPYNAPLCANPVLAYDASDCTIC
jgi:hypothetical protein